MHAGKRYALGFLMTLVEPSDGLKKIQKRICYEICFLVNIFSTNKYFWKNYKVFIQNIINDFLFLNFIKYLIFIFIFFMLQVFSKNNVK